ncbi:MAG: BolA-like protein [uncultured bacterium]|nr:MAG: BolA-like protein [uncultured bacterium]
MKPTIALIEEKLISALNPSVLLVKDDREAHLGHAHENSGHFTVKITSNLFSGKSAIARHRLVYQALGSLMQTHIHALKIDASAPSDKI